MKDSSNDAICVLYRRTYCFILELDDEDDELRCDLCDLRDLRDRYDPLVDLVNVDREDIDFEDFYVRKVLLSSPQPMPSALAGPSAGIAVKSMHGGADIGIE